MSFSFQNFRVIPFYYMVDKSRLAEHKLAIKTQEPEKSALCEHYMRFDSLIDWNNSINPV